MHNLLMGPWLYNWNFLLNIYCIEWDEADLNVTSVVTRCALAFNARARKHSVDLELIQIHYQFCHAG